MKTNLGLITLALLTFASALFWSCETSVSRSQPDSFEKSKPTRLASVPGENANYSPPESLKIPHQDSQQRGNACPAGRLAEAWRDIASENDPGRKFVAEVVRKLGLPQELTIEIGNAAWEQQELARFGAKNPGIDYKALKLASETLSEHRLSSLTALGHTNLDMVWSDLMQAPVQSPIHLSPPVSIQSDPSNPSTTPITTNCTPSNQRYEAAAKVLTNEFPDLYGTCDLKLQSLGYLDPSRPYYIRRIAEDLRSIWIVSGLSGSVDIQFIGLVPLPDALLGDNPPFDGDFRTMAGWLYRRSAIQYLKLQGGPKDKRFYQEVYSVGIAGHLSPL